jgi:hypothetical protein
LNPATATVDPATAEPGDGDGDGTPTDSDLHFVTSILWSFLSLEVDFVT